MQHTEQIFLPFNGLLWLLFMFWFLQNAASRTLQSTTPPNIAFRRGNPFLFIAEIFTYPRPPTHCGWGSNWFTCLVKLPNPPPRAWPAWGFIYSSISHFALSLSKTHFIQMRPVCESNPVNANLPISTEIQHLLPSTELPPTRTPTETSPGCGTNFFKITKLDTSFIYYAEYQYCYYCVIEFLFF